MPSLPISVTSARRAAAADDRGEGVISAGIVVLIMAAIGLAAAFGQLASGAALPFVDDFLPVRTLSNLADLAAHLNQLDGG